MTHSELLPRLNGKNTLHNHTFTYTYKDYTADSLCIYLDFNDEYLDRNKTELLDSLVNIYGSKDFEAFRQLTPFMKNSEGNVSQNTDISSNIIAYWFELSEKYLNTVINEAKESEQDYLFTFLPSHIMGY